MNTPAHLLLGMAFCTRPVTRRNTGAAAMGSLVPDLSLYVLAGTSLFLLQIPPERVFGELYFSPEWQMIFAIDNSFVIWALGLAVAMWFRSAPAIAFACAGLLHLALDFPLHNDDARRHLWPVSDWVFESPLSYWESHHHAAWVAPFGLLAVLAAATVLWWRWPDWRMRLMVLAACGAEIWVVRQWLLFF